MQDSSYNQFTAFKAIFINSLKAALKNPQAIFFSFFFPLIFVFIFGSFGGGGQSKFDMAIKSGSDTTSEVFKILKGVPFIKWNYYSDTTAQRKALEKGNIDGEFEILKNNADSGGNYKINLHATNATEPKINQLKAMLENVINNISVKQIPNYKPIATVQKDMYSIRPYRQIDFVLPGQIGFSLLFSTLFGIAFLFFTLREQLVLKRFYATPVNRLNILMGIGFSRLVFQLISVTVLILVGTFALHFTLAHGFVTFLEMILMSIFLLILLMGVGLIFSGLAKTDTTIPLMINIFSLPQIMLSGTFFPVEVFPIWLQHLCKILPLYHFNSAIRRIAFEGAHLWDCGWDLLVLGIWTAIVYLIASKVFRWE